MAVKNELTREEREAQADRELKFYEKQSEKQREHQLKMQELQVQISDKWPVIKSIAYAPCYIFAMFAIFVLALIRRDIPQVLIDFLNS